MPNFEWIKTSSPFSFTKRKFLAAGLVFVLNLGPAAAQDLLVRVAVGEWPPYFSETAEGYGTYAQVVTRAFELEGMKVEYGFFPWNRALLETKEGRWPVSAGWGITEERKPYFHFCDAVLTEREQFFHSRKRPVSAKTMEDFDGLSIGVLHGAALGEDMDRLVAEHKVTIFRQNTLEDLFKMLRVGRVDLVPGNEFVAGDALTAVFTPAEAEEYEALTDVAVEWDYRVIVSRKLKNGQELCQRFNRGLEALRASGEYEQLFNHGPSQGSDVEDGSS